MQHDKFKIKTFLYDEKNIFLVCFVKQKSSNSFILKTTDCKT